MIFVYFCCILNIVINLSYFLPLFFFKMFFMIKADDTLRLLFSVISISELCYAKHDQEPVFIRICARLFGDFCRLWTKVIFILNTS